MSIGSVPVAAGDVGAGQALDARAALAGALAGCVLPDSHQGECIGVAYRAGRVPGTAAGGGRQLVRRALGSWPGWRMRLALAPSRRRHGDVDPGEHADVDQIDVVAAGGDVDAGLVLDARTALAGMLQDDQYVQGRHSSLCIAGAWEVLF